MKSKTARDEKTFVIEYLSEQEEEDFDDFMTSLGAVWRWVNSETIAVEPEFAPDVMEYLGYGVKTASIDKKADTDGYFEFVNGEWVRTLGFWDDGATSRDIILVLYLNYVEETWRGVVCVSNNVVIGQTPDFDSKEGVMEYATEIAIEATVSSTTASIDKKASKNFSREDKELIEKEGEGKIVRNFNKLYGNDTNNLFM